jgi:group II intron reverse transcriptase/maturase
MIHLWRRRRSRKPEEEATSIFSTEAMRRSWQSIRHNGSAPGVDRVTIRQFGRNLDENLAELREELVRGTYEPRPVKRVLVPKPDGGLRPLAIWTLRDRIAQRVVHDYLVPIVEPRFLDCSYGFRPGRSVSDAVASVIKARDNHKRWVVDADIKDCFSSLRERILIKQVKSFVSDDVVVTLIEKWLHARVYNPARGQPRAAMASQGGVITPLLANIYLHRFDAQVTDRARYGTLVRFADDFVILCRRRQQARTALATARQALGGIDLRLNRHKTRLVNFDDGFKFLGVFFLRNEHFYL